MKGKDLEDIGIELRMTLEGEDSSIKGNESLVGSAGIAAKGSEPEGQG